MWQHVEEEFAALEVPLPISPATSAEDAAAEDIAPEDDRVESESKLAVDMAPANGVMNPTENKWDKKKKTMRRKTEKAKEEGEQKGEGEQKLSIERQLS